MVTYAWVAYQAVPTVRFIPSAASDVIAARLVAAERKVVRLCAPELGNSGFLFEKER